MAAEGGLTVVNALHGDREASDLREDGDMYGAHPPLNDKANDDDDDDDDGVQGIFTSPFCSRTFLVLLLVMIVDKADQMLIPSVYLELGEEFDVGPTFLGTVTLFRGLAQALVALASGPIGDRYNRITVCSIGVIFWGFATLVVGGAPNMGILLIARTCNGIGLGLVIPLVQAMASDMFPNELTGRAFGLMGFMSNLGGAAGAFLATSLAAGGGDGWRGAFYIVGFLSLAVGLLLFVVGVEPRKEDPDSSPSLSSLDDVVPDGASKVTWEHAKRDMLAVLRLRTFQCILLQGAFGEMPWYAMNFMTMWFEMRGFSHAAAGIMRGVFDTGVTLGNVIGGVVSDWSERASPDHGRVAVAQFTVFIGIPLWLLILFGLPESPSDENAVVYAGVGFLTAALISWAYSTKSTIMSEIVRPEVRSTVYALDRVGEGTISAASAPLVGLLAEQSFGYNADRSERDNAQSLAHAMAIAITVPWFICFVAWTVAQFSYRGERDAVRVQLLEQSEELQQRQAERLAERRAFDSNRRSVSDSDGDGINDDNERCEGLQDVVLSSPTTTTNRTRGAAGEYSEIELTETGADLN